MKKKLLAGMVALALGTATAAVAGTIVFDRDGPGPAGAIATDGFDWGPGNLLFDGMLPTPSTFTLRGHHSLSDFLVGGNPSGVGVLPGTEITVVYGASVTAVTGVVLGTAFNVQLAIGGGTMAWFFDPTKDASAVTGLGYGDATPILVATFNPAPTAAGTVFVPLGPPPPPLPLLDGGPNGVDDSDAPGCAAPPCPGGGGVLTQVIGGSVAFKLDILSFDPAFFPAGVATPLIFDITYDSTTIGPFVSTEPSDIVGFGPANATNPLVPFAGLPGAIPNYGEAVAPFINDQTCGTPALAPCDVHTQGDATSTFQAFVPEPHPLALLGLGLGVIGMVGKRRRAKASS